MCIVQLHSSSKPTSEIDFSVPARIVTTADEKHERTHVINSQRRAPVSQPPSFLIRAQRRNTMAPGGPERASYLYVSSRGAAYHRCNEKFFYGRDSGEPLLLSDSDSDASSTKSATTAYDATRRATHRDS